ncbi:MAG TPA: MFS transporter [Candidatus Bathyarchaeia archaeon]|nr:MFS transporter [Candidatus Bathyarchaeia archaeon]
MLALLRDSNYLRYWLSVVISFIGDGITKTAVIYLVATASNDPFLVGLAIFAQMVPIAVLGIFIGPLLDRLSRRWIMIAGDLYRMLIVLFMILAQDSLALLLLLVVMQGIGTAFFETARIASVPELVGQHRIPEGVALFQATTSAIGLLAPSLAGLLLAYSHISTIFLLDAASYFCSAALLFSIFTFGSRSEETQAPPPYWHALHSGLRDICSIPALRLILLLLFPVMVVLGLFTTNLKVLLLQFFHVPALHYGLLEGTYGAGAFIGAFLGVRLAKRLRATTVLFLGMGLMGAGMMLTNAIPALQQLWGLGLVYVWCLSLGFFHAFLNFPLASLFMMQVPAHLRGRGMALFQTVTLSFLLLGVMIGGSTASGSFLLVTTFLGGLLLLIVSVLSLVFTKGASIDPSSRATQ